MPWVRRRTPEALADHGLKPGDVKYVINTHLNDHGGDNYLFTEATFIVQKPEWDWLAQSPNKDAWDFPGVKVELLNSEDDEVLPGVTCLFTPGHTPGHQSILVEDAGEKTLFLGDAAYTIDIWEHPDLIDEQHPAFRMQIQTENGRDTWLQSMEKLKDVKADTSISPTTRDPERAAPALVDAPATGGSRSDRAAARGRRARWRT